MHIDSGALSEVRQCLVLLAAWHLSPIHIEGRSDLSRPGVRLSAL